MRLTKEQYKQTLVDPVAFHRYILRSSIKLSKIQKAIMRAFAANPETLVICGAKGGKSTITADVILWRIYLLLQMKNPAKKYGLTPGTNIYCMSIAPKEDIAIYVLLNYMDGLTQNSWYLNDYVINRRKNELIFIDNIIARSQGSSSRAGHGYAIFTLAVDEFAHFMDTKGTLSGTECINAFMPRLLQFGTDSRFIGITTPAGRSGAAYEMFITGKPVDPWLLQKEKTHGEQPFRAVFQAPTWVMNPLYPRDHPFLKKEYERDPWFFEREYGGKFADSVSPFFDMHMVNQRFESFYVPPRDAANSYVIALDAGLLHDRFALAMGHLGEKNGKPHVWIDFTKTWQPPKGDMINMIEIEDYVVDLCKNYRVVDIICDIHLLATTIQRLANLGLPARGVRFGTKTDVMIYQPLLEATNMGTITIQFSEDVKKEFVSLQRIVLADRYRVQAGPGSADDLSDAIALVVYALVIEKSTGGTLII